MSLTREDRRLLDVAARLACRGHGWVEPNPMVGCVVCDAGGRIVAMAHHQRFGGPHAEVLALRRAGEAARGGSLFVTLEPCGHTGKTPPCADAVIVAGISRVVIGALDPNPQAQGGLARLQSMGLEVEVADHGPSADVLAPFRVRLLCRRPWITLKWAQTLDGFIATRTGDSKWISSAVSRRRVHRARGRVDAVLTGIGTVLADDPRLTARDVRRRRVATRIVIDPKLQTPPDAALCATTGEAPLLIVVNDEGLNSRAAKALGEAGATLVGQPCIDGHFDLPSLMRMLLADHHIATVLVEAGQGILSSLIECGCADELAVFIAPRLLGDPQGLTPLRVGAVDHMTQALRLERLGIHERGGDVLIRDRLIGLETTQET